MRHSGKNCKGCLPIGAEIRTTLNAVLLAVTFGMAACGDGDANGGQQATSTTPTTVAASRECADSFKQGHESEKAGEPTPQAFLPSIRACRNLAEWTAAERAFGVNLLGREAEFVDNTCSVAGAEVQSSLICREAKAAHSPPGGAGQ